MIGAAAGPWSILDVGQLAATKEYHREIMEFGLLISIGILENLRRIST